MHCNQSGMQVVVQRHRLQPATTLGVSPQLRQLPAALRKPPQPRTQREKKSAPRMEKHTTATVPAMMAKATALLRSFSRAWGWGVRGKEGQQRGRECL